MVCSWRVVVDALGLTIRVRRVVVRQCKVCSGREIARCNSFAGALIAIATKLALDAGGYDWGFLAYAVGFGGSMMWFGSSAGVALCSRYPEARSALAWLRGGWHVILGYVVGFIVLLLTVGWHPHAPH